MGCTTWCTKWWITLFDEALAGLLHGGGPFHHPIDNSLTVVDNGRGYPVDMHEEGVFGRAGGANQAACGRKIRFGIRIKVSGGLHGVGVSCVNARSLRRFIWKFWREREPGSRINERGIPKLLWQRPVNRTKTGTKITFKPDATSWTRRSSF